MSVAGAAPLVGRSAGLLVAANRLPVAMVRDATGALRLARGAGGLVTALLPVVRSRGGTWVGWAGLAVDEELEALVDQASRRSGFHLVPIALTEEERRGFYEGFSNEVIWPLFHDQPAHCRFDPSFWEIYRHVNRRYARTLAAQAEPGELVWVHDYQLMLVATALRELGAAVRPAFFLHVPFPSVDLFQTLPWRLELLRGLLDFDLLGFQTARDRRNFTECARRLIPNAEVEPSGALWVVNTPGRRARVGVFPVGIDFNAFHRQASSRAVAERVAQLQTLLPDRQLILGLDRLDYSKGIPLRLEAFRQALLRHPELHERVTLIEVVVPSRVDLPQYQRLKREIERLVGEINGQFTRPGGWVPIHYLYRSLERTELLAFYRAASIALVTPLKDGMNLVAKEYCACSLEENGVLILSEFAGAAAQLGQGAVVVNPYDVERVAEAIFTAFCMPNDERRERMRHLRRAIRREDVFWWVDAFLRATTGKEPIAPVTLLARTQ